MKDFHGLPKILWLVSRRLLNSSGDSSGVLQGRWYITAGLNPLFDQFDCQEHFFGVPEPGEGFPPPSSSSYVHLSFQVCHWRQLDCSILPKKGCVLHLRRLKRAHGLPESVVLTEEREFRSTVFVYFAILFIS